MDGWMEISTSMAAFDYISNFMLGKNESLYIQKRDTSIHSFSQSAETPLYTYE